jgi:hypothetical protein
MARGFDLTVEASPSQSDYKSRIGSSEARKLWQQIRAGVQ